MATRPSSSEQNIVNEARQCLGALKKNLPAILKADKAKGKTAGVNAAFVKSFAGAIAAYDGLAKAHAASASKSKSATSVEVGAREALSAELKSIRADVADANADDVELQTAFGRGLALSPKTTPPLVEAAISFEGAFDTHEAAVKSAGVNAKRIQTVAKLRAALQGADEAQGVAIGARTSTTSGKSSLIASIKKMSAQGRKRLKPFGAGKSAAPRHTVKKRQPKPTAAKQS